jgi:hypothetical protein
LLGIYLNDHLAGASAGTELARRMANTHRDTDFGSALRPISAELVEDRAFLLEIMKVLGIPARRYKVYAGWAAEKVGRLKSNGYLMRRSPLSSLVELETLRLGVEGKAAGWQTLRVLADGEARLDAQLLDTLYERAQRQRETLEGLRLEQAARAFQGVRND